MFFGSTQPPCNLLWAFAISSLDLNLIDGCMDWGWIDMSMEQNTYARLSINKLCRIIHWLRVILSVELNLEYTRSADMLQ